jgi:2,5-diketo-D-gluconate reductase A
VNAKMNRRQFLVGSAAVAAAPALVGAADAAGAGGIPFVTLNNGVKMPALGFGTLHLGDAKATQRAVEQALEVGFRLFDTAQSYANEEAIGAAFKATGVKRSELFVTCKLFRPYASEALAGKAYEESLRKLNLDYADLYLIHQPVNDTYGAYRAMTKLYRAKAVRAIGVSNFNPARVMDFAMNNEVLPAVNQIECNPYCANVAAQRNLIELGIQMEAFSPLRQARENILNDPILAKVAAKHGKSVAQVILRWQFERGVVAVVKSTNPAHMREDVTAIDFALDAGDMAQIAMLNTRPSLIDHQDPARIKWFNERVAGEGFSK